MLRFLLSLSLASLTVPALVSPAAAAPIEDLDAADDEDRDKKKKRKKGQKNRALIDEVVREIERGLYVKGNMGGAGYLLSYGANPAAGNQSMLQAGLTTSLAIGNDFVDTSTSSMAYEVALYTGLHNGMNYIQQQSLGVTPANAIQGDSRIFSLLVNYEYSAYPTRRLGIGFRAGAGVQIIPLLMDSVTYNDTVLPGWGLTGQPLAIHSGVQIPVFAGPTLEYYTKLSHFSLGIDVDVSYVILMGPSGDIGIHGSGFLKYTF